MQCNYARNDMFTHKTLRSMPGEIWQSEDAKTRVCKECLRIDKFLHELTNKMDKTLQRLKRVAQNHMVEQDLEKEGKL